MHQTHYTLTPTRPPQSQSLTPNPLLFCIRLLDILLFLFSTSLLELKVPRRPLLLPALMYKLLSMLLEHCHGVQRKLVVLGDPVRRTRNDHGADCFVGLREVFH